MVRQMRWESMVSRAMTVSRLWNYQGHSLGVGVADHVDRTSRYPPPSRIAHPKDCSVMTYRGHAVLRTLIRCHFSPRESTGQGYIYSGR